MVVNLDFLKKEMRDKAEEINRIQGSFSTIIKGADGATLMTELMDNSLFRITTIPNEECELNVEKAKELVEKLNLYIKEFDNAEIE